MDAYIHEILLGHDMVIVRFSGCDYRCPNCNTPGLVEFQTGELLDTREAARLIDELGKDRVKFTGGEPLLQRQALLELLRHCRKKGYRTIVDTNASKPEAVQSLVEGKLVDEFHVDVKAPLAGFAQATKAGTFFKPAAELFNEFKESLKILEKNQNTIALSFTTLIVPGLVYKKEDLLELARLLQNFDAEWHLLPFDPSITLDPALRGVAPPTTKFIDTLAGFIRKEYPNVNVLVGQ